MREKSNVKKDACVNCAELKRSEGRNLNPTYKREYNSDTKEYRRTRSLIYRYKTKYGIQLNKEKLFNTFTPIQWWKWTYYNTPNGKQLPCLPKEIYSDKNLSEIVKYVIEKELNYDTREKILNLSISDMKKYKINFKHHYKKISPIFIIDKFFSHYIIKPYELNNVPLDYWKDKNNADEYMRSFIEEEVLPNIKNIKRELPQFFTYSYIRNSSHRELSHIMTNYRHYDSFLDWINALYPNFNLTVDDFKMIVAHDGSVMGSNEEKFVYELLKKDMGLNAIATGTSREYGFFDPVKKTNYFPDFIIKHNDQKIVVEYFGLYVKDYRDSILLKNYFYRTKNKIAFFTRNNIPFIPIFPEEIKNTDALRNKISTYVHKQTA